MRLVFGARGGQIVTALALLSIVGIVNAVLMFTPRTLYALAASYPIYRLPKENAAFGSPPPP